VQAVEINAGAWCLRALRGDDRLSDVPALTDLGLTDPAGYIAGADRPDADGDVRCVWAVCIPTTGELIALIGVTGREGGDGALCGRARSGYAGALADVAGPVRRFAEQALSVTVGDAPIRPETP